MRSCEERWSVMKKEKLSGSAMSAVGQGEPGAHSSGGPLVLSVSQGNGPHPRGFGMWYEGNRREGEREWQVGAPRRLSEEL